IWPKAPPIKQVVLSAHSAGGFSLTQGGMLGSSSAPSASSGKKLGEVALFDAINGKKELAALEKWLFEQQLPAELKILAAKGSAKEQSDYLTQSGLRFRAYFTGNPAKAKASASAAEYAGRHLQLKQDLDDWFNTNTKTLDPKVAQDFAKNYQV